MPCVMFGILLLSTHSHDPCFWGESDLPACGPPAGISVHLASSAVNPVALSTNRGVTVEEMMCIVCVSVTEGAYW